MKQRQLVAQLPDKLTLLVTGTGKRTSNETADQLLFRTDDATLHFEKHSKFEHLPHALVDRYNAYDDLVKQNAQLLDALREITDMAMRWSVKGLTPTIHKAQTAIKDTSEDRIERNMYSAVEQRADDEADQVERWENRKY